MIAASILCFTLAAILGAMMLRYLLRNKHIPKGLAVLHGFFAVAGLLLLIIYNIIAVRESWLPILVFAIAALGGLALLHRDLTSKAPKWLGVAHGLMAVTGFLLLLGFAYSNP